MAPAVPKKAQKLGRALKSAARFPGRGSGRNHFSPSPGEQPVVYLRVQVQGCRGLARARNGSQTKEGDLNPLVVVSLLNNRHHTPVLKRTPNPIYTAKDATFDFPIYISLADRLGSVELVVWDKDTLKLKKEYVGEAALTLESWFRDDDGDVLVSGLGFSAEANKPRSVNLVSTRANTHASGMAVIKLGFVAPPGAQSAMDFERVFAELVRRSRPSLVSAPPTEGIGTMRSHLTGPAYEDDGGISSDEEDDDDVVEEGEEGDEDPVPHLSRLYLSPSLLQDRSLEPEPETARPAETPDDVASFHIPSFSPISHDQPEEREPETARPLPPVTTIITAPTVTIAAMPCTTSTSKSRLPKLFPRRPNLLTSPSYDTHAPPTERMHRRSASASAIFPTPVPSPVSPCPPSPIGPQPPKKRFRKSWSSKKVDYNFSAANSNDIVGIVMLEIQGATDLPRLRNITRTGFDMDPFVVISFSKKIFRTRIIRHSLNPTWDEKLLFHVRRYETSFKVQLTVLDWDKLSSNDHVGDAWLDVGELVRDAAQPDPRTGLYADVESNAEGSGEGREMKQFCLPLTTAKEMPWEAKHNPTISFRAKFQPYAELRQRFWAQYLKQYDTDDTGSISRVELTSMLDSLGSTLSAQTIDSFFTRHRKRPAEDELTFEESIQCLETELGRPACEKKRIDTMDSFMDRDSSASASEPITPGEELGLSLGRPFLGGLDFSGPPLSALLGEDSPIDIGRSLYMMEPNERPLLSLIESLSVPSTPLESRSSNARQDSSSSSDPDDTTSAQASCDTFERVINIRNCPLCHRPRLNSKAEMDIITHLAICASQDWAKVDRIVVGNFVTASQAQRKWYTKVISKVSNGNYRIGANSANIIVQNRMTGQLEEEKMQVYVRLGIRLLYKGARGRMEGARARRLLKSLSIKQGAKYDSPESARDIPSFIEFHGLKVDEILEPISSFKTFNDFFYRKLKPSARPVESPDDSRRLVSAADCRLMVFETVSEATKLWIKGREFSVARLLGDVYRDEAERYVGGPLAIFRLAPQDYHRFHVPVDGRIGEMKDVKGEYYTVNPQAIRSALDVYGENVRKIVPIDSPQFGRVMVVCVGAMMVGSIKTTVEEGQDVKRGQELGYFAFGGSTIVVLFERGAVEWDEDLVINGRACLETLVRVGMGIGTCRRNGHGGYQRV
ncbi:phosphatidylserine decarboxylase-domain-containing protein [Suillus ampliporus]|nr:phosphatidylserine decarboxylase-domain-containing protein [Suillus ampliporus]